jgi:predicted nucleic acid-binding protein
VPSLRRLEVANALQMAVRRKRIKAAFRDASRADLRALGVAVNPETDRQGSATTLHLAERFRVALYKAVYLELAQRLWFLLATLNQEMRAAGGALGVKLYRR